ncbi:MAG: hypothetical protein K1X74_17975 [Pirellulales bacterium]|nr:hypothetical protein [Pirellulales bacterium]
MIWGILCVAHLARATNYSDGGSHTISGADGDVVISNNTTVHVVTGADVQGTDDDPAGFTAISMYGAGSTLDISGGTIAGGDGSKQGGAGVYAANGHVTISNGNLTGGNGDALTDPFGGGAGAYFEDFQSLSISGGSFTGGNGGYNGGAGVRINAYSPKTAYITGGDFQGGAGNNIDSNYDLHVSGLAQVDISGGHFHGYHSLVEDQASATISNGQFDNYFGARDQAAVEITGGTFDVLEGRGMATYNVSGGTFVGLELYDSVVADQTGGTQTGAAVLFNQSILNLSGGLLASSVETFVLLDSSVLNVYGYGLTLTSFGGPYYQLQGTLADGTPIGEYQGLTLLQPGATVNLITVPEPGSAVLAAIGGLGLLMAERRRRSRPRSVR